MATKQQGSFRPACRVEAEGDTWIDDHHTNEDIALALGTALSQVGSVDVFLSTALVPPVFATQRIHI